MRLFRQIVKVKYQKFLERIANKKNDYWDFFQVLNLVCVMDNVGIDAEETVKATRAWKNSVTGINIEKSLSVMEGFREKYAPVITNFLKETESLEKEETTFAGMYEKGRGIIGVGSFDFNKG